MADRPTRSKRVTTTFIVWSVTALSIVALVIWRVVESEGRASTGFVMFVGTFLRPMLLGALAWGLFVLARRLVR